MNKVDLKVGKHHLSQYNVCSMIQTHLLSLRKSYAIIEAHLPCSRKSVHIAQMASLSPQGLGSGRSDEESCDTKQSHYSSCQTSQQDAPTAPELSMRRHWRISVTHVSC